MSSLPPADFEDPCSPPPLRARPLYSTTTQPTDDSDELSKTPTASSSSMCQLAPSPLNGGGSVPSQLSASRPVPHQPPSLSTLQLDDSRPSSPLPTPGLDGSSSTSANGAAGAGAGDVPLPTLLSTLTANDGESILVLVVDEEPNTTRTNAGLGVGGAGAKEMGRVYGGSQGGAIHVWDLSTLSLRARLTGHTGAVLALQLVKERDWLISASGDGTIRVWHLPSLTPLYLIHPPHDNVGDIFSLAWVPFDLLGAEGAGKGRGQGHGKGKGRLYAGCQDTSIMWIDLPPSFHLEALSTLPPGSPSLPLSSLSTSARSSPPIHRAPNKFFDSLNARDWSRSGSAKPSHSSSATSLVGLARESGEDGGEGSKKDEHVVELQFRLDNVEVCAHYGYVYCLLLGKSNDQTVLVSGSGDELLRLWSPSLTPSHPSPSPSVPSSTAHHSSALTPVATLESSSGDAVLAVAGRENTVFAGHQGGVVKVWDLDTFTCVRTLRPHHHDILTLTLLGPPSSPTLFSGASDGTIQRWDRGFNLVQSWEGHQGIVLASTSTGGAGLGAGGGGFGRRLLTGGSDNVLKIWDFPDEENSALMSPGGETGEEVNRGFQGEMFHTLSKLISFRTIADDSHREECRQGAGFLKRVLRGLGGETHLLPGAPSKNPLILATFRPLPPPSTTRPSPLAPSPPSAPPPKRRKRILVYGHYDVVSAAPSTWTTHPFKLEGKDGWLYGRGVSDNKGPMLAVAAAVGELRRKGELEVEVVMLVEGEEETGSAGFQEAVRRNRHLIGNIDVILVSNSYWIGEDVPCLTFGLRGVIHATLKISSDQPDLHSGMQGGVVSEPLVDMVRLLASLTDADGRVRIPGFLDDVRKLEKKESELYDAVIERCKEDKMEKLRKHSHVADPKRSLITRWRQPALSIHDVQSAGSNSKSLIPSWASAAVSIRIVPDQSLLAIIEQLKSHLAKSFGSLRTVNQLSIDINHVADWWLGDIDSPYFTAFASCIQAEWGIQPLFIREGGSIPSLPFLEREFGADAVHFPMGTSSDSAHLPDERIRTVNLEKGKSIVSEWLKMLGKMN
ncbi:hypothetical protein BCR35DRAFT_294767 [Leucosporidium creatinivorum]|uniref:Peptidase M20 dimerisation domain-containing protein n=1 Tax=Leucosporidium creatinivorum TaxID=106004 RepID=A0A1Y2E9X6_9BASI|nr:hypothetical protein BCR35DRAFT_294767 [Leucosporidium creatinivorum]